MTQAFNQSPVPRISPDAYQLENFEPLLSRPDTAAGTARFEEATLVTGALAQLSQVALMRGGLEAYGPWRDFAAQYVSKVAERGMVERAPVFNHHLVELYFHGAVNNDAGAAARLTAELTQDIYPFNPTLSVLRPILEACAYQGIYPGFWINREGTTADMQAAAWSYYLTPNPYRRIPNELPPKATLQNGVANVQRAFYAGELPLETSLLWASHSLHLAGSADEKLQSARAVERLAQTMRNMPELPSNWLNVFEVVASINVDPDIPAAAKRTVSQAVSGLLPPWAERAMVEERASFELSCLIRDNASPKEITTRIREILQAVRNYGADAPTLEDPFSFSRDPMMVSESSLLRTAATHYITAEQPERAASLIASIKSLDDWQKAVQAYADNGGDLGVIRQLERGYSFLNDAVIANGYASRRRDTAERTLFLDYLEAINAPQPDFEKAFQAILQQLTPHTLYDTAYIKQLDDLLFAAPEFTARGAEILERLDGKLGEYTASIIRRLLIVHGAKELESDAWQEVQAEPNLNAEYVDPSAAMYLAKFASMALVSAGVMHHYS